MDAPVASTSSSAGSRSLSPLPREPSPDSQQRHWQAGGPLSASSRTSSAFAASLSQYLEHVFLPSVCPARMEYHEKEATRVKLEILAGRVLPGAKLKPFGSTANGLSLRNSDMDLCCLLPPNPVQPKSAAELVEELGTVIQQETNYMVKMLPRARIPIIKLGIPPSPNSPFGMSCDIGFDNRLALQNTRLLLSYVQLDPRVRPMILFIKVWTKRRKINNPYLGTLSSYGYALLVLSFLVHIRKPPVLPNLQRVPPQGRMPLSALEINGHDVYFFEDVPLVKRIFGDPNKDSLGELLVAFFNYYAREFRYPFDVVSLQSEAGVVGKDEKGWYRDNEAVTEMYGGSRDLNRLCIEDPFQRDYNVARTVTRDGLYTIRGEFMRASRALASRSDAIATLIGDICEEREDEALIIAPPGASGARRRSAPSPRLPPSHPPPMPTNGVTIPQSAADFRQWLEANTAPNGMSVSSTGQLLGRSAISESGEVSPTMPPLPPPRAHISSFNPRTMPFRHPGGNTYQPMRRPPPVHNRMPISPPTLERRLSWDGPSPSPTARDFNRFFQSPSTEVGPMAQTAPTSPLFASVNVRGGSQYHRGPRSQSHSGMDRRMPANGILPPPQAYVNGYSGAHTSSASPSSTASQAVPSFIRFGNFASDGSGLGLFDAPLDDGEDDEEASGAGRTSTSLSSHVGSDSDVIVFGDVPVVRRGPSSSIAGDDEAGSGVGSRRRSGAVSPTEGTSALPSSSVSSTGLPIPPSSTSMSVSPASRSSRGSAPPAVSTAKTVKSTLAEHLARLDVTDKRR